MITILIILFLTIVFLLFWIARQKGLKRDRLLAFFLFGIFYLVPFAVFALILIEHQHNFDTAIDPIDEGYSPFGHAHVATLLTFWVLFVISAFALWLKGRTLPPLTTVLAVIFIIIGILISIAVIGQFTSYSPIWLGAAYPFINIVVGFILIFRLVRQEADTAQNRTFRNKYLNKLNTAIASSRNIYIWVAILLLPVLLLVTLILLLFGQHPLSLVKVFTETTTWAFSQQTHPPYLDHTGHYLCTVAACGKPRLVKPLRIGTRHGNPIIVNRQLMVANAFEEMISDRFPRFHRLVRYIYDTYGFPLSQHITTSRRSNAVYILMKPLEWMFVVALYLFCCEPEKKIARQYQS